MRFHLDPLWQDRFVLSSTAVTGGERNSLARDSDRGELCRLAPGVYVDAASYAARTEDARHRELVYARFLSSPTSLVVAYASAGAMWRLPRLGPWPTRVHVVAARAGGGRSTPGVVQHRVGVPTQLDEIDGIRTTSLARTVADLARSDDLATAIMSADAALAGLRIGDRSASITADDLEQEASRPARRGRARLRFVAQFADPRSGSPGESLSRVSIRRAGLPSPELQTCFEDREGRMYADFSWPARGLIGEFDGVGKYLREEFSNGRSTAEVVIDEKRREDRLRALGWRVVRWGWAEARSAQRMGAILRAAGLR